MTITHIVLSCDGVPPSAGLRAAADITAEFAEHRPWFKNVICSWVAGRLVLAADSDTDHEGLALMDEFSDCLAAYTSDLADGELRVDSLTQVSA